MRSLTLYTCRSTVSRRRAKAIERAIKGERGARSRRSGGKADHRCREPENSLIVRDGGMDGEGIDDIPRRNGGQEKGGIEHSWLCSGRTGGRGRGSRVGRDLGRGLASSGEGCRESGDASEG